MADAVEGISWSDCVESEERDVKEEELEELIELRLEVEALLRFEHGGDGDGGQESTSERDELGIGPKSSLICLGTKPEK